MKLPERALSVRQPWAWAILNGKDIENRSRRTHYRGDVLLHASLKYERSARPPNGHPWPPHIVGADFQIGGIIGVVEIVDCVEESTSPWFAGPFGYVLANPRPLAFMPMMGALGFFKAVYEAPAS